jgi:hypothetical protein
MTGKNELPRRKQRGIKPELRNKGKGCRMAIPYSRENLPEFLSICTG